MNRRNFFKMVTGFVAGIFVGSAKAKPQLTVAMLQKAKKELDAKKVSGEFYDMMILRMAEKLANPPYIIYPNGKIEQIPFKDFYKQV